MKKNIFKREFYCCDVNARHEIFEIPTILYTSVAKLKKKEKCWKSCGIAKITISGKTILPGKW